MGMLSFSRGLMVASHGEDAAEAVSRVMKVMLEARDGCSDTFDPTLQDDGMLLLDLGSKGQYSLQPAANNQLLLFSPLSGPKYYHYDVENRWWCAIDDGHLYSTSCSSVSSCTPPVSTSISEHHIRTCDSADRG